MYWRNAMTNDEIIRRHVIEFVNCYWNVGYDLPNRRDTYIGIYKQFSLLDKLMNDFADIEEYIHYFDSNLNPLDSIINILNDNLSECCYVLANYAIADNDTFHYLDGKIINELVNTSETDTDWYNVVKLDYEYKKNGYTYKANKLFIIGDDSYKEVLKKTKTIEYYEVKNET
jgi:hypothetical protein